MIDSIPVRCSDARCKSKRIHGKGESQIEAVIQPDMTATALKQSKEKALFTQKVLASMKEVKREHSIHPKSALIMKSEQKEVFLFTGNTSEPTKRETSGEESPSMLTA
ncbi:hypothetical protein [Alkalihalobacillus trypoxylicola]|uniref:Uncharacterized protein n=1 Tax=Alkalihalobacillus trypoxylicola TaxID=519424 RepID=A0A161P8L3_9BACI|nr:hypothetical protein [Alkalihalobacillus trypoxylicola]KYG27703.1 hypothetical protein AZF04_10970 [Alkalihalobacillus trypoxylicola]